jgi:FdhE protein
MQRILEPGQIEAFAQRSVPRIRLPTRDNLFAPRAARLRQLSEVGAIGHSIAEYLHLMAALVEAQQTALVSFQATPPDSAQIARAREFGMPLLHATSWRRDERWRDVLAQLCASTPANSPAGVHEVCNRLRGCPVDQIESQADALLAARSTEIDAAAAPFIMGALQVHWIDLASRLAVEDASGVDAPGVCPVCGVLPVASVVRTDSRSQGYRYLHCALCATEWHMVRVTCSHCRSTKGVTYQTIDGAPDFVRAECCDECRTYRKILYQEKDVNVEPVADDLASLALDLLVSEAGYHRASGNPLLWQKS